jgi:hypothetical protein
MSSGKIIKSLIGAVMIAFLAASPAATLSRKPPEPSYTPGQVVLRFQESVDSARSLEIVEAEGASIKTVLKRTRLHLVLLVEEAVERFRRYPEVLSAEPDYRARRLEEQ